MSEIINVAIAVGSGYRLEKNKNYCMLITNVSNNKKRLFKAGNTGIWHINRIWLKDANGNKVTAEYLSDDDNQQVFKQGEMAQFYVEVNGTFVDEIKPLPGWLKGDITPCPNPHAIKSIENKKEGPTISMDEIEHVFNEHAIKLENKTSAIQMAKDIVCAQIAAGAKLPPDEVMIEVKALSSGFLKLLNDK